MERERESKHGQSVCVCPHHPWMSEAHSARVGLMCTEMCRERNTNRRGQTYSHCCGRSGLTHTQNILCFKEYRQFRIFERAEKVRNEREQFHCRLDRFRLLLCTQADLGTLGTTTLPVQRDLHLGERETCSLCQHCVRLTFKH